MKSVLYIGGFEMPDKNAAAQRVLSIAKSFRSCGCNVHFHGITHCGTYSGTVDGFSYSAYDYPRGYSQWVSFLKGNDDIRCIQEGAFDAVIAYNYPALALHRVRNLCKKKGIKLYADVTEWYHPNNPIKWLDTTIRMRFLHKKLDGLIVISSYLANYYKDCKTVEIPPTVDCNEDKWAGFALSKDEKVRFVYVGSPGGGTKDKLNVVIDTFTQVENEKMSLTIVGLSKEQYETIYSNHCMDDRVTFKGRLPHKEAVRILMSSDFQMFFRDSTRVNNAGFPTKFAESVTAGCPVIANDISNIKSYVDNGLPGFIVPTIDEKIVSSVIDRVSNKSRIEINEMKLACYQSKMFDYQKFSNQLNEFIAK